MNPGGRPSVAEVVVQAAVIILKDRGEEHNGKAVAGALTDAFALTLFSTMDDPSDTDSVREIVNATSAQVTAIVEAMCAKVEALPL